MSQFNIFIIGCFNLIWIYLLQCIYLFIYLFKNATVFVNTAVPTEIKCVLNQPCEFPIPISGQNLSRLVCYAILVWLFKEYLPKGSY